jgi:hypothetical protein
MDQDFTDLPTTMFIKLPHLYKQKVEELYQIWIDQVIEPSTTTDDDDWFYQDGINHCDVSWLSFYSFAIDVGVPPKGSTQLNKISQTEPLGVNNFFWSLTPVGNWNPSVTKQIVQKGRVQERSVALMTELDTLVLLFSP